MDPFHLLHYLFSTYYTQLFSPSFKTPLENTHETFSSTKKRAIWVMRSRTELQKKELQEYNQLWKQLQRILVSFMYSDLLKLKRMTLNGHHMQAFHLAKLFWQKLSAFLTEWSVSKIFSWYKQHDIGYQLQQEILQALFPKKSPR